MVFIVAILTVAIFSVLFKKTGVYNLTISILGEAREASVLVRNPDLSDEEKEKALQKMTVRLFKGFARIALLSVVLLLVPALLIYGLDALQVVSFDAVIDTLLRTDFIIGSIIFFIAISKLIP